MEHVLLALTIGLYCAFWWRERKSQIRELRHELWQHETNKDISRLTRALRSMQEQIGWDDSQARTTVLPQEPGGILVRWPSRL